MGGCGGCRACRRAIPAALIVLVTQESAEVIDSFLGQFYHFVEVAKLARRRELGLYTKRAAPRQSVAPCGNVMIMSPLALFIRKAVAAPRVWNRD